MRALDPGVKGSLNLGLHASIKATAGERLSRRWVNSSGVLTMTMSSFRSSGIRTNGSEHGFPDPFDGTNNGHFEGMASAMGSSRKAIDFVYDPLIQSVRPGE